VKLVVQCDVKRVLIAIWNEAGGTMKPLDDERLKRMKSKQLIEMIEWDSGLLAELFKDSCITVLQKMSIQSLQGALRSERLLEIMSFKSIAEYNKFRNCLMETGQHHIETILRINAGMHTIVIITLYSLFKAYNERLIS